MMIFELGKLVKHAIADYYAKYVYGTALSKESSGPITYGRSLYNYTSLVDCWDEKGIDT
jgi:hypothetical protein